MEAHQKRMDLLTNNKLVIRRVELKDFPNYKKLLVIMNIPLETPVSEIEQFFLTILNCSSRERPIEKVKVYETLGICTLEFKKKQDSDVCLLLDDVKEFSITTKLKMRIFRVKRFITFWNNCIHHGLNPQAQLLEGSSSNF